jgi:hypothetical protein
MLCGLISVYDQVDAQEGNEQSATCNGATDPAYCSTSTGCGSPFNNLCPVLCDTCIDEAEQRVRCSVRNQICARFACWFAFRQLFMCCARLKVSPRGCSLYPYGRAARMKPPRTCAPLSAILSPFKCVLLDACFCSVSCDHNFLKPLLAPCNYVSQVGETFQDWRPGSLVRCP